MTTIERIGVLTLLVMLALMSDPGSARAAVCGNGVVESGEECDDGNVTTNDGCSDVCAIEPCAPAPVAPCFTATRAQLLAHEKVPGKERLRLRWTKIAETTTQSDYGDPASPSSTPLTVGRSSLCIYDDLGALVQGLRVVAISQGNCLGNPGNIMCWKATNRGYLYSDSAGYEDGVTRIQYTSGDAGKGKASAAGSNQGYGYLPDGIAAALAGNVSPTIQLVTTEGFCVGATMNQVTSDDGVVYGARKK